MDFEKLDRMFDAVVNGMPDGTYWYQAAVKFMEEYQRQRQESLNAAAKESVDRLRKLEDRMDIVEKYCHSHVAGIECGYVPASFHCAREGDPEMSKILDTQVKNSKQNPRSYSEWEAQQRIPAGTAMYHVAGAPGTVCSKRQDDDEPIRHQWMKDIGFEDCGARPVDWEHAMMQGDRGFFREYGDDTWHLAGAEKINLRTRRDLRLLCELLKIELKEGT